MNHLLSDLDISLLNDIIEEDPSFDITSALFKFKDDMQKRKRLSSSRTKMLYDLMRDIHWRIDIESINSTTRIAISARINGKYISFLQDKLLYITEDMFKPINHNNKIYEGTNMYILGYVYTEKHYIDNLLSELRLCEQIDPHNARKGYIHY